MRTILTAAMVFAILFMVGCGATAEEKNTMKTQGDKIATLEKSLTALQKSATDMGAKTDAIDVFLKAQFPKAYGVVDTSKKAPTPPPAAPKPPKTTEPKKGTKGAGAKTK